MIDTLQKYKNSSEEAANNPSTYWAEKAEKFVWNSKWDTVCTGSFQEGNIKWFDGAQLNITESIFESEFTDLSKVAFYYEPNELTEDSHSVTYGELFHQVNQAANLYKSLGVKKGDVVAIYMPMIPEAIVAVLACARIGAVHSIVFGGFSAEALASRINDSKSRLIVTADCSLRGNKKIPLLSIAQEAVSKCSSIEKVLVVNTTNVEMPDSCIDFSESILQQSTSCPAEVMNAEDPLFILYTSGSTGQPKGLVHTTAGYMVWAAETFKQVFQYQPEDVFWCTADIGWITGHSYFLYGPMLNQATQMMFEGVPTYPSPSRFWQVIEKYKVTHFYTAPTAVRALEACGLEYVKDFKMSSLKVLGSVGEPINQEAWDWLNVNVGKERCDIVDTWWQTETGGIMISNLAGVTPSKPTYATLPLPGVVPALMDQQGNVSSEVNLEGPLCIANPWPGMARTVLGDHKRYMNTYFSTYPGFYFTGDGARRDKEGNYRIIGRIDDVINTSGHRVSTAEVENVTNEHASLVESAVIGVPHDIKGQCLWAFAIPTNDNLNAKDILADVNKWLVEKLGAFYKLERLVLVDELPKTRSGKIMRRILRKLSEGSEELGDLSTLLNPDVVNSIKTSVLEL